MQLRAGIPRIRTRHWTLAAGLLSVLHAGGLRSEEPQRPPLDLGEVEHVEVQLVLLDLLVLDRRGRTVPGLTAEDFDVLIDGRLVEVASLDTDCPDERLEDPRAGEPRSEVLTIPAPREPRNIVLVFDYGHLPPVSDALPLARAAIERLHADGDRIMIVSLGAYLRIELPFTDELEPVLETIERIEHDEALFGGYYSGLNNFRWFGRIEALLELLEPIPGRKTVLLYSAPLASDGFYHDTQYRRLAGLATAARTALYPVDSRGLVAPSGFRYGDLGPPRMLNRLATETGGRMTFNTNDLGLAYARAQRDAACTYTLGLYRPREQLDRDRRLAVYVRRPGIRVLHSSSYVMRSPERKLQSLIAAANLAPEPFLDDRLEAALLLLEPKSGRRWNAMVAVRAEGSAIAGAMTSPAAHLVGTLRKHSGTVARTVEGDVPPLLHDAPGSQVLLGPVSVQPGSYTLSVVLSQLGDDRPLSAVQNVEVPEIPRGRPFVIGPMLGRPGRSSPTGARIVEPATDETPFGWDLEPLVLPRATRGELLAGLTRVCRVGADRGEGLPVLRRVLVLEGSGTVGAFDAQPIELDPSKKVSCRSVLDWLPTGGLAPGDYVLDIRERSTATRSVPARFHLEADPATESPAGR